MDRDILTLAGIVYWISAISYIQFKIGTYSSAQEISYLNTLISGKVLNLREIEKQEIILKIGALPKSPNTLCLIRGFMRVCKDINLFYLKCIEPVMDSYFDYILKCCEAEQVNCQTYALLVN